MSVPWNSAAGVHEMVRSALTAGTATLVERAVQLVTLVLAKSLVSTAVDTSTICGV